MAFRSILQRIRASFRESAGTIVFGMEDGTVSIFGLIFGVAAATDSTKTVLIAGASGAAAAAVSMMAGAYLDAETTRDEAIAKQSSPVEAAASLASRFTELGLPRQQATALTIAVQNDRDAIEGLSQILDGHGNAPLNPSEQALWMLVADFLAAAVPIAPFVIFPIGQARYISGAVTIALLVGLGIGRAAIARRNVFRTIFETVSIGVVAGAAGVGISLLIDRLFVS